MKRIVKWLAALVILTAVFHVAAVALLPRVIMSVALGKIESQLGLPLNQVGHGEPRTADTRTVVRPSPDLLYSIIRYDVSEKPLRITAPVPDSYWSVSFFADNTDNYFALNDRQVKKNPVEIILIKKGAKFPAGQDAEVVEAKSEKGVVLLRLLIQDENEQEDMIKIQKQAACEPVS
jgi:uncharacterized membrane protein